MKPAIETGAGDAEGSADRALGTVLIVDDNPENLGFLFEYLEECGFKVLVALDGEEALSYATHALPDMILLDVMMPGIDGFDTCARLKTMPEARDTPVIFMSALSDPQDKLRAFELGGVDYVTKPINKEEVLARINAHVSLRRLQTELEERNLLLEGKRRELEERNEELDAFSHMVAHDLRNALVRVVGFADLLLERVEDYYGSAGWDGQTRDDLQSIQDSALQMQEVIDSLLLLAGISRRRVSIDPLDMGTLVGRVVGQLKERIHERQATVRVVESWPAVRGYRPWVERVWHNYIENGIKYGGTPPELDVGAGEIVDGMVRFWVRDNGPGIPEEAREAVFRPFTRLHEDRAEGHGLGLSIVQRIVKALGGEVGAERLEGGGTEFYFTLPATSDDD
ncbi:hybrid sensor histidine kinase/response regulator [Haliangium ochraceum]|uniref:histidine kinase n=1 Tax=Haliangium ochraceum (strain DSM 14365 / JCM 11303 / SMP-2) TaxID=502025 RepID=D0LGZ8_HALO1|nr:hybrid sensor histidine kinase/response regulator [Haliangium ochraceum]ACY14720.1 response regulator receiver sensor signal transduction histidine kinase [Haliangium ochraceum DSM 14365]